MSYGINQIKTTQIKKAEDIKNYLQNNKFTIRFTYNHEIYMPPVSQNTYTIDETQYLITLNGAGEKAVRINGTYYNYNFLYKCLQAGYKNCSKEINSFFLLIFEDYTYKNYTKDEIRNIIKNRKNAQYLLRSEVPKYIDLKEVYKMLRSIDLPIIKSMKK